MPTAVAWPTLGRPIWATLWTTEELWAKSTVTASCSPGTDRVAVSPVAAHELLQVRPREPAQVEAPEDGVAELDQPQREPVAARLGHVLDVPRRGERREQARDRARVDAGAAGDLVRAELVAVGERVEHRERALDGGDVADGWLTGAGRGTLLLVRF